METIEEPVRLIFNNYLSDRNRIYGSSFEYQVQISRSIPQKYSPSGLYSFEDIDGYQCYLIVRNNSFTLESRSGYCPDKKRFSNQREQIANYIYDSFIELDIPEELSYDYLGSSVIK